MLTATYARHARTIKARAICSKAETVLKLVYTGIAVSAFAVAVYKAQPVTVELAAYTFSGERFVAGSGDTCRDAFQGSAIPEDWRELRCEAFDVFGFAVAGGGKR